MWVKVYVIAVSKWKGRVTKTLPFSTEPGFSLLIPFQVFE